MSAPRLHLAQPLLAGGEVRLAGDRAHYLRTVLRLREGEPVLLFAAAGEWRASLRAAGRHEVLLLIEERTRAPLPEPGRRWCSRRSAATGSTGWSRRRPSWVLPPWCR
ncbi:MAG: RNA methyltransferase PUA domain-containing protein [Geminicoccaceae bacterium]